MIDKIRKLLALASNNPNEEEAAAAMAKARSLMLAHGIEESALKEQIRPSVEYSERYKCEGWQRETAKTAAQVVGVCTLWYPSVKKVGFLGRPEALVAAILIWDFLNAQIDQYYKAALPKGLSQSDRAQYRKSFKEACARRVLQRAVEITQRDTPQEHSFALVLVDEIEAKLREDEVKESRPRQVTIKDYEAAVAGYAAGNLVNIQGGIEK